MIDKAKIFNDFFEREIYDNNYYSSFEIEEFFDNEPIPDEYLVSKILQNCTINYRKRKAKVYLKKIKGLFKQ